MRRQRGALRQGSHLIGHDSEAATLLAGARRFNGGIQRKQFGLFGDGPDAVEEQADFTGLLLQDSDHSCGGLDRASRCRGGFDGAAIANLPQRGQQLIGFGAM